jgi:hypothetical protein
VATLNVVFSFVSSKSYHFFCGEFDRLRYRISVFVGDCRIHVGVDALPDGVGNGADEVGGDGVAQQVRDEDLGAILRIFKKYFAEIPKEARAGICWSS